MQLPSSPSPGRNKLQQNKQTHVCLMRGWAREPLRAGAAEQEAPTWAEASESEAIVGNRYMFITSVISIIILCSIVSCYSI